MADALLDAAVVVVAVNDRVQGETVITIGEEHLAHPVVLVGREITPRAGRHRLAHIVPLGFQLLKALADQMKRFIIRLLLELGTIY